MAVTVERLIATLEARIDKYEKNLQKAYGQTDRQFTRIERRGKAMEKRMASLGAGLSRTFVAAFAGAVTARGAKSLIDAATKIDNALKVAGLSGQELDKTYQALAISAQRNAAPLEALVELYSRAALVQKELGISSEQLLDFTDKVALALRVSGQSAAQSSGALLQLSQALGSGVVRAEEFNSMLEGALPIVQAAAAGIVEAGGSVSKLRQLVVDGKVSSEAFFKGFEAGSYTLKEKVAGAALTMDQRFENFHTTLLQVARGFNKNVDAGEAVGDALDDLATIITDISAAAQAGLQWLDDYAGRLGNLGDAAWNAGAALRNLLGLPNIGRDWGVNKLLGTEGQEPGKTSSDSDGPTDIGTVRLPPISIKDYAATGKASKGRGGGKRSPTERFQSDVDQIKARTEAIRAETAALAGLNPLIDDYGFAVQKAGAKQDLLNAAKRAGLKITPELEASIESLAEGYASASAEAARLAESQDEVRQRAEEMRDLGRDVMGGFIHDLLEGRSAADALKDALGRVADKLIDIALNDLFSGKGSGSSSILGSLAGGIGSIFGLPAKGFSWDGGGYTGAGGKRQPAGVVHKGEYVFDQESVRAAGGPAVLDAMRRGLMGYADGGLVGRPPSPVMPGGRTSAGAITYAPSYTIHSEDGDPRKIVATIEEYDKGRLARLKKDLPDLRRRAGRAY